MRRPRQAGGGHSWVPEGRRMTNKELERLILKCKDGGGVAEEIDQLAAETRRARMATLGALAALSETLELVIEYPEHTNALAQGAIVYIHSVLKDGA